MHIMEGYLPATHAVGWTVVSGSVLAYCGWSVRRTLRARPKDKFLLSASAAYMFTLSALKMPSLTGSCSHPTGVGLGAVLFGWRPMVVIAAIVLLFQSIAACAWRFDYARCESVCDGHRWSSRISQRFPSIASCPAVCRRGDLPGRGARRPCHLYNVTAAQLAFAFPDEIGGFAISFGKFLGVFAVTQVPLAIAEGLLTVLVLNALTAYDRAELQDLGVIPAGGRP